MVALSTFLQLTLAPHFGITTDTTGNPDLVAALKTSATQLDQLKLLSAPHDSDWLFDFNAQSSYTYSPGSVINANVATFPALAGTGMTTAMLNLGPCAMLPPHFHPRAVNLVIAVEGETQTYIVEENGARVVTETLTPGKMTIFPKGSLHTMQNLGCGNATLVSALNSEDAGTHNILNGLFRFPNDIIDAAFGGPGNMNYDAMGKEAPPVETGSNLGSAECLARCHMK